MNVANKHQAEDCLKVARKHLANGNIEKAKRFCEKSSGLFQSHAADQLLREIEVASSTPQNSQKSQAKPTAPPKTTPIQQTGPIKGEYTPEQVKEVKRIRSLKDYYKILGLEKNATEQDIKKAYKKAAIRFHPDKNHAPGAEEAFKSISSAYQCLIDAEKRKGYDQFGTEDMQSARFSRSSFHQEEMTPEELFSMFFGGPVASRRGAFHFRRAGHTTRRHSNRQEASLSQQIIHFLPLLIVLLFAFLNTQSSNDLPFRLEKTSQYSIQRTTSNLNVPYYVDSYYTRYYGRDRRAISQIEGLVEKDFFRHLKETCEQQKSEKARKVNEAKRYRGEDQPAKLRKAHKIPTKACSDYEAYYWKGS